MESVFITPSLNNGEYFNEVKNYIINYVQTNYPKDL